MATTANPKPREAAGLWLLKIVLGVSIVFLLGLHFIVNHWAAPGGLLTWADVVSYYQNPIIPIVEAAFLIAAVSHGLIGLRSIILDLNPSDRILKLVDITLLIIGGIAVIYGLWLLATVVSFGR